MGVWCITGLNPPVWEILWAGRISQMQPIWASKSLQKIHTVYVSLFNFSIWQSKINATEVPLRFWDNVGREAEQMRAFSEVYISTNISTVLLTLSMGITPCPALDPMLFCGGLHDAEGPQGHPGRMEKDRGLSAADQHTDTPLELKQNCYCYRTQCFCIEKADTGRHISTDLAMLSSSHGCVWG